MGALAPVVCTWSADDDLLLKSAMEGGASLESLAKGAVGFSRKFTIRELHDRWYSLLFDPDVSEEASSRIVELERCASFLSSKVGRSGNSKDSKSLPGKRKSESVRSCYYALRKRIRNASNDGNYVGMEDEPLPGNCMLGNPISDHFGVQQTNIDIMDCSFPILADGGAVAMGECTMDGFQTTSHNFDDGGFPSEPVSIHTDIPHMLGDNQFLLETGSGIDELPGNSMFDANDLMVKPSSSFDQINNDPENICSEFDGNHVFNSPIEDCGLSIWQTDEGLSASGVPIDGHGENQLQGGDIYALPGDIVTKSDLASGHDDVNTDSKLESDIPCEDMENQTADTEGYLVQITNTLMNDEPFFMDIDAKDVIDKSYFDGLSSFLASSPNNCDQVQMPDVTEAMTSETQDNLANVSSSHVGELDGVSGSVAADGPLSCDADVPMIPCVTTSNSQFPELTNGVICCTLNTEDWEIPCNDDVMFSKQLCPSVVSSTQHIVKEAGNPLSSRVKDFHGGQKTSDVAPLLVQRDQTHGSGQINKSHMIAQAGKHNQVGNCGVKFEDSSCVAAKTDGFPVNGSAQVNSKNVNEGTLQPTLPKTKSEDIIPGKHLNHGSADTLIEKPTPYDDSFPIKQEVDALEKIKDHQSSSVEAGPVGIIPPEPVIDHPPSDIEELMVESDGDVPYFSDIEAMIHDMDLVPDDEDWFDQEVARYQSEDAKRRLMRLEQACHAFLQRDIASHGAFAALSGRHSRHYIKKHEILLGRTTEDFVVDIDLGREGCANKVSRRQAIINMEEDGSFHLKNLGKCSVFISSRELGRGQSLSLNPGCLIQVKGVPFIFDTNQTCVKQYLNSKLTNSRAPC